MVIILAILFSSVSVTFIILLTHYYIYHCFPWQKHLMAKGGSSGTFKWPFNHQYDWHKTSHTHLIRGTTTSLTFESFKTFYELNPEAWEIQEKDFGADGMYFQVVYCNGTERIRVIFSKSDFQKYRKWLAQRAIEREKEVRRKEKIRDLEYSQKIIEGIKQDIIKKQDLARSEIEQAKKITEDVKQNLKWIRYEEPVVIHNDRGVKEIIHVWREKPFETVD